MQYIKLGAKNLSDEMLTSFALQLKILSSTLLDKMWFVGKDFVGQPYFLVVGEGVFLWDL